MITKATTSMYNIDNVNDLDDTNDVGDDQLSKSKGISKLSLFETQMPDEAI